MYHIKSSDALGGGDCKRICSGVGSDRSMLNKEALSIS